MLGVLRTTERVAMGTVLYQHTNIEIFWQETDQWLYADWRGYQAVDDVKRGCEQILQLMRAKGTGLVLNDNSHVEGIWIGAAEWVAVDWFPRMRAAGLRCFAWVYSPSRFSQISTDATLEKAPAGVTHVFWSVLEAAAWLRAQRERL